MVYTIHCGCALQVQKITQYEPLPMHKMRKKTQKDLTLVFHIVIRHEYQMVTRFSTHVKKFDTIQIHVKQGTNVIGTFWKLALQRVKVMVFGKPMVRDVPWNEINSPLRQSFGCSVAEAGKGQRGRVVVRKNKQLRFVLLCLVTPPNETQCGQAPTPLA